MRFSDEVEYIELYNPSGELVYILDYVLAEMEDFDSKTGSPLIAKRYFAQCFLKQLYPRQSEPKEWTFLLETMRILPKELGGFEKALVHLYGGDEKRLFYVVDTIRHSLRGKMFPL